MVVIVRVDQLRGGDYGVAKMVLNHYKINNNC